MYKKSSCSTTLPGNEIRRSSSKLKHSLLWPNKTTEGDTRTEEVVNAENDFIHNMNELCLKTPERLPLSTSVVKHSNLNEDVILKKTLSFFDTSLEDSENEENIQINDVPIVTPTKILKGM